MLKSLKRSMELLLLFADAGVGGLTVSEVAKVLNLDKSIVSRTLSTFLSTGFVARNPIDSRHYVLGPALVRLGKHAVEGTSLLSLAHPYLQQLQELSHETVSLQIRRDIYRYCIDQVQSSLPIRRVVEMDAPLPLHQGSSGAILLAFARPDERDRILEAIVPEGERTQLCKRLEKVRQTGHAISISERVDGISGISVGIINSSGEAIAAIAISGPGFRWTEDKMMTSLDELVNAAHELSSYFSSGLSSSPL